MRRPKTQAGASVLDAVALHVGMRLRLRRMALRLELEEAAPVLGVDVETLRGIEYGDRRVTAAELYQYSRVLEVPVSYFYEGLEDGQLDSDGTLLEAQEASNAALSEKDGQALLDLYYDQMSPKLKKKIVGVARILADEETSPSNKKGAPTKRRH
jgi:transcriptional regulator with XRE-family HTH domain